MNQAALATAGFAYLDTLYNLAVWLVGKPEEASALVQDTYRRALHTGSQQFSGTKLRVQLLTIMWDLHRQHRDPHADPPQLSNREGQRDEPTVPHGKATRHKRSVLHTLPKGDLDVGLRQLPEDLRAVLILADMEGCSLAEVAEIFACSAEQAQATLSQARQSLHGFLQARVASSLPPSNAEEQL